MSDIEEKMWATISACPGPVVALNVSGLTFGDLIEIYNKLIRPFQSRIVFAPQVAYRAYRVDFGAVTYGDISPVRIAVECDGHYFHERTKTQAAHDKSRDRLMTEGGILMARFTGSEIFKSPSECVSSVLGIAASELQRQCEIKCLGREVSYEA